MLDITTGLQGIISLPKKPPCRRVFIYVVKQPVQQLGGAIKGASPSMAQEEHSEAQALQRLRRSTRGRKPSSKKGGALRGANPTTTEEEHLRGQALLRLGRSTEGASSPATKEKHSEVQTLLQ